MKNANRKGMAKTTKCLVCGGKNRSHSSSCCRCRRIAENKALPDVFCALCEKAVPRDRKLISPYCSLECATETRRIGQRAVSVVQAQIRKGAMPKLSGSIACVDCGAPAEHYDHRDYSKPLDVAPVCRSCNFKRGPASLAASRKPVAA